MANLLTGDYDVVAQFSLGAADRVIAALHSVNRLPHSLSLAVDDLPQPPLGATIISVVDSHHRAAINPKMVKLTASAPNPTGAALQQGALSTPDIVVNLQPASPAGRKRPPLPKLPAPSNLSGVAQLQLGSPTIQLLPGLSDRAQIHIPTRIRYFPDPNTAPLSQFMRGDIVVTVGVLPEPSPDTPGMLIVVDLNLPGGHIFFNLDWSDTPLALSDTLAIDLAMSNALRESFPPSSTPMPPGLQKMDFKAFPPGVLGVMLNVKSGNPASPNSVNNVFLNAADQFAVAVNGDVIAAQLVAAIAAALPAFMPPIDIPISLFWVFNFHVFAFITIEPANVQFLPGQIVLTIPVSVVFGWENKPDFVPDPTNFTFTVSQGFTLSLSGTQVSLVQLGGVGINIPSNVPSEEADPTRSTATNLFNQAWASNQAAIQQQINQALGANALQSFLEPLINPPGGSGTPGPVPQLAYTSFEIDPAGIVLHGTLGFPAWPAVDAEYVNDPQAPPSQPEYNALNSWIPGGTITEFEWLFGQDNRTELDDPYRFVTIDAPAILGAPVCLSLSGTRISASGPVTTDTLEFHKCTILWFGQVQPPPSSRRRTSLPLVAIARPPASPPVSPDHLQLVAHASPWAPSAGATANLVVHFPSDRSVKHLGFLTHALGKSSRTDTATGLLCVLTKEQVSIAQPVAGLLYADDADGWEKLLSVESRPTTVVLDPTGEEILRHEGNITAAALGDALRRNLVYGGKMFPQFASSPLTIGGRPPNFVMGDHMPLRKLAGNPAVLVFVKSASAPCHDTLRNLRHALKRPGVPPAAIVAIHDGEDTDTTHGQGGMLVVADPSRQISEAYGITMWPTSVFLDEAGRVQSVRFGLIAEQDLQPPVTSKAAPKNPAKEA